MTIQELFRAKGITFVEEGSHHHARPGWINLDCPFCGEGSDRFHLGYNLASHYFFCWKCGHHFNGHVFAKLGLDLKELDEDTSYIPAPRERTTFKEPHNIGPLLPAHRRYLESRKFDSYQIEDLWKIQGIGISSQLSWRIYIPITFKNTPVSWTTRSISPKAKQRYISASAAQESMNHKYLIYGAEYCHHSIVIVEGPTDVWNIGPGAGALFGTAFSGAQVRKLVDYPHRYVCFDNSADAQTRAKDLCSQLSVFPGVTENVCLDAEDPGSASRKEIALLRQAAKL